jgi:hypothetical protein
MQGCNVPGFHAAVWYMPVSNPVFPLSLKCGGNLAISQDPLNKFSVDLIRMLGVISSPHSIITLAFSSMLTHVSGGMWVLGVKIPVYCDLAAPSTTFEYM